MTPTSTTGSCASLEDLSALVDGTLAEDVHAELIEHVGACDRCLELVSQTVWAIEEMEGESGAPAVGGSEPERARRLVPLLAAAAVLLALVAAAFLARSLSRTLPSSSELVAQLPAGDTLRATLPAGWLEPTWTVTRSSAPGAPSRAADSFRLGAQVASLAVASRAGDSGAAGVVAARLESSLQEIAEVEAAAGLLLLSQLRVALAGDDRALALATVEELDGSLEEWLDDGRYAAGRWTGFSRAAQLAGAESYFASRPWRRGLRALAASSDPEVAAIGEGLRAADRDAGERRQLLDELLARGGDGALSF